MIGKFAEASSIHGIREWYSAQHRLHKCYWTCLLCIVLGGGIWNIIHVVREYREEPIASINSAIQFEQMPDVLFCPRDWIKASAVQRIGLNRDDFRYIASLANLLHIFSHKAKNMLYDGKISYKRVLFNHKRLNTTAERMKQEAFLNKTSGFQYFDWFTGNISVASDEIGNVRSMNRPSVLVTSFGTCYNFSSSEVFDEYSLYLLNISFTFYNQDVFENPTRDSDMLLLGDNAYNFFPEYMIQTDPPGRFQVRVDIGKTQRVSTRRAPCKEWSYKSWKMCKIACRDRMVLRETDCSILPLYLTHIPLTNVCSTLIGIGNYTLNQYDIKTKSLVRCFQMCYPPCTAWHYSTISSRLETRHNQWFPSSNETYYEFKIANAHNIHFIQERKIYSWMTLLSNIGGMLSLFCGASLISFAQICACGSNLILDKIKQPKLQRHSIAEV